MSKEIKEGTCPKCGEYTEISWEDDGCCGAGAECEGHIYHSDDFEKPDSYYEAKALNDAIDAYRGK